MQLPTGKESKSNPGWPRRRAADQAQGAGHSRIGGRAGDVLITVSIAPHALFVREGADLRLTPDHALRGGARSEVRVPTLDGEVELAIPAGTDSGRTFRLKGRGFPGRGGKGDLLATVRIALPEVSDGELDELMRKWRERKPYDPRKAME